MFWALLVVLALGCVAVAAWCLNNRKEIKPSIDDFHFETTYLPHDEDWEAARKGGVSFSLSNQGDVVDLIFKAVRQYVEKTNEFPQFIHVNSELYAKIDAQARDKFGDGFDGPFRFVGMYLISDDDIGPLNLRVTGG